MKPFLAVCLAMSTLSAWAGPSLTSADTESALAEVLGLSRAMSVRPSSNVQQLQGAQQGTVLRNDVRFGSKSCSLELAPIQTTALTQGSKLLGTTNVTVVQRAPSVIEC
jgi:hypothetical protein